jgi:hypothetical protein
MIEINLTNFITIGVMAMLFFALAELVKKKLNIGKAA